MSARIRYLLERMVLGFLIGTVLVAPLVLSVDPWIRLLGGAMSGGVVGALLGCLRGVYRLRKSSRRDADAPATSPERLNFRQRPDSGWVAIVVLVSLELLVAITLRAAGLVSIGTPMFYIPIAPAPAVIIYSVARFFTQRPGSASNSNEPYTAPPQTDR